MKKHLIAAGLVAAFAAPAMAQNVSVYGIIDTAIVNTDTDGAASTNKLVNSAVASERLGFKGEEDLGGGMKAFFRLEQSIGVANGTQNTAFNRGSEVGLSGAFGSIKVGKFDISGAENVDSAVSQMGNVGLFSNDIGSDVDHSIQYSNKIGGVSFQLGHSMGDGNGSGDITSVFFDTTVGGVMVQAGYTTQEAAAGDNTQTALGLKANAGPATVGLGYSKRDNATGSDTTQTILSASMPVGGGLKAMALIGKYKETAKNDADEWAVGVMKDLSKRTSVYAAYNSNTSASDVETKAMLMGVIHKF